MARSDQKIRARLTFLEWEARHRPRRHALRLVGLVLLGYLYPAALLLGTFALAVGVLSLAPMAWEQWTGQGVILYLAALLGVLTLTVAVGRTFRVTLPDPFGHALAPTDAAPLRAMIEDVRRAAGGPPVHHVLLDARLNAAVSQRRRFGFWGPRTNYLTIGLPLLIALTPAQLRAVLSHEFAHLRGQHGAFGAWIYRVQQTWESLAAPFKVGGRLRLVTMGWFVRWYGARFATSTLALRRQHEYDADRHSAALDGPAATADALVALDFAGYRLEVTFWPSVWRGVARDPLPPADVLARLTQFLSEPAPADTLRRWRARELRSRTPITAEHPCLADRLAALGSADRLNPDHDGTDITVGITPDASALSLLGDARERLCGIVNASWKVLAIEQWRSSRAVATKAIEQADKPDDPFSPAATPADREWEKLQSRADYAEPDEALALLREFLTRFPDHAPANFSAGRILLQQDDDRAADHLDAAARNGSEYIRPSLEMRLDYFRQAGRDEDAEPIRRRLEEHERALARARRERLRVGRRDRFLPHDLPAAQLVKLCRVLNRYPRLRAAYLARKQVRLFTDKPVYVLGVVRRTRLLDDDRRRADRHLIGSLHAELDLPCAIVVLGWSSAGLRSRLQHVCPTPVFESND